MMQFRLHSHWKSQAISARFLCCDNFLLLFRWVDQVFSLLVWYLGMIRGFPQSIELFRSIHGEAAVSALCSAAYTSAEGYMYIRKSESQKSVSTVSHGDQLTGCPEMSSILHQEGPHAQRYQVLEGVL